MNDYIEELKALLAQLDPEERNDVLDFYTEYLQDGKFVTYNDCVRELGTPRQLARKVLADYSIKNLSATAQAGSRVNKPKEDVKTIWLIVLAVLSTPITIPLAIVAIAVFSAVIVAAGGLMVAMISVFFAVILSGLVAIGTGLGVVGGHFWVGVFYLGAGLLAIGLIMLLSPALKGTIDGIIHGFTLFSKWMYDKLVTKNRAEKHGGRQQK